MTKKIDMLMAYPNPTDDSPYGLTPLSILYPGAMFEEQGKTVEYWDGRWDPPDMLDDLIRDAKEIGVSAFTGYQSGHAADILTRAKRLNPSIITHVGGHHARLCPDDVKAEWFVDNVWPERSYGENLFPYSKAARRLWARGDVQYITSAGCPYACSFCALRSAWSPRPIEQIDRELKILHNERGFSEVSFTDPNIGFEQYKQDGKWERVSRIQRLRDIGRILRDLGVRWDGNIRSNYFTPELVDVLAESGCFSIEIGCESGNEHFLRKVIQKGHGVESIKNAARLVKGSGISIMYSFIRGMPRETDEAKRDTLDLIDWIVQTDPDARISLYNYAPYPGGPAYEDAVAGVDGYPKFIPPTTMAGWGKLKLMVSPAYWVTGLCFRLDNSRKNFQGDDWRLIEPYVNLARQRWKDRDIDNFPAEEVEALISAQVARNRKREAA